ncbi:MAG: hypothetical protein ACRD8Z_09910 [Nitrososphaeraceae archaeon]
MKLQRKGSTCTARKNFQGHELVKLSGGSWCWLCCKSKVGLEAAGLTAATAAAATKST